MSIAAIRMILQGCYTDQDRSRHANTVSVDRLARALDEQVHRFARAIGGARRGEVAGVHQARVASRRLRELLPVAAWAGPDDLARRARVEVRQLTRVLGAVRELDVTRGLLDDAATRHAWLPSVVAAMRRHLDADRLERHRLLAAAIRREATRQMLRDLRRVVTLLVPKGQWAAKLDPRRRKRARALAASLRDVGTLYVPVRLHAVRIAAKKLRYSLEADRAIRRAPVTRDIHTLEAVQEHLGQLHDLQMLQERLQSAAREAGANRPQLGQLRRMSAEIEGECRTLHAQVVVRAGRWLQMATRLAAR